MGLGRVFSFLFGGGRNVIKDTAEVFIPNAEASADRDLNRYEAALAQLTAETRGGGIWNGFVDGLNRLPRPVFALGTVGLFAYAMADPHGFALRMSGLAYIPEPLWWLLGAVVGFYFGARELHYARNGVARQVRSDLASLAALSPNLIAMQGQLIEAAPVDTSANNAALAAWRRTAGKT